ncbi:hypothetical protein NE237_015620 [Protea cynaroides]|uniref:Uncharacterized protein n=1 Tax=Protea cynaroides TaxID=273540 RepID=A0A9Q0KEK3_9MAGN|nr:hypothetical protein NE237_015620 [Protea cynaroides]
MPKLNANRIRIFDPVAVGAKTLEQQNPSGGRPYFPRLLASTCVTGSKKLSPSIARNIVPICNSHPICLSRRLLPEQNNIFIWQTFFADRNSASRTNLLSVENESGHFSSKTEELKASSIDPFLHRSSSVGVQTSSKLCYSTVSFNDAVDDGDNNADIEDDNLMPEKRELEPQGVDPRRGWGFRGVHKAIICGKIGQAPVQKILRNGRTTRVYNDSINGQVKNIPEICVRRDGKIRLIKTGESVGNISLDDLREGLF